MTTTFREDGNRCTLRIEREFAHDIETVWRAITEPEQVGTWYPAQIAAMEPGVGGSVRYLMEGAEWEVEITAFEPPRLFETRGSEAALLPREQIVVQRIELSPTPAGTRMLFTHSFEDRFAAASYAVGWYVCLDSLDAALAGRPAEYGPMDLDAYERSIAEFGIDGGLFESNDAGWNIRLERQLMMAPVEAAWEALTGADEAAVGDEAPERSKLPAFSRTSVTETERPDLLVYQWSDATRAGEVRWTIGTGPGGARYELTQTGTGNLGSARAALITGWKARLVDLAAEINRAQREINP